VHIGLQPNAAFLESSPCWVAGGSTFRLHTVQGRCSGAPGHRARLKGSTTDGQRPGSWAHGERYRCRTGQSGGLHKCGCELPPVPSRPRSRRTLHTWVWIMPKKSTFNTLVRTVAAAQRQQQINMRQQARMVAAQARAAEQQARRSEREAARSEREAQKAYLDSRAEQIRAETAELDAQVEELTSVLNSTLAVDDFLDFESLKQAVAAAPFQPGALGTPEPQPTLFVPPFIPPPPPETAPLSRGAGLVPGRKAKHEAEMAESERKHRDDVEAARRAWEEEKARREQAHQHDMAAWAQRDDERVRGLEAARSAYEEESARQLDGIERANREVDEFKRGFEAREPQAVVEYFSLVLDNSLYPEGFDHRVDVGFIPETQTLVIEKLIPGSVIVPAVKSVKYVRSRDERTEQPRSDSDRKKVYNQIVCQIALRSIHEVFEADRSEALLSVEFNGFVEGVDPASGRDSKRYIVAAPADRSHFLELNLGAVDATECVKAMGGKLSPKPLDGTPVKVLHQVSDLNPELVVLGEG
jgi:restriction system protein